MKKIAVLGSTGSIGTQTLDIVRANPDLKVVGLSAGRNVELMEKQVREFMPAIAGMGYEEEAKDLRDRIKDLDVKVLCGMDGMIEMATMAESDVLLTAIVGMIGIRPTIAAINAGKTIALANKETLVTAGHIIIPLAKEKGVDILPVDSEDEEWIRFQEEVVTFKFEVEYVKQVQSDWNQNDETQPDFIKNRICYEDTDYYTREVSFDDPYAQYQIFKNIETGKMCTAYMDKYIAYKVREENRYNSTTIPYSEFCHKRYGRYLVSELKEKYILLNQRKR